MIKKSVKHRKSFPAIFFSSVSKEALKKHGHSKKDDRQKLIWLWGCVSIIMAAVVFFWVVTLPARIKLNSANDATAQLFKENKDKLSELFEQNKNTMEFFSASPELYNKLVAALASSTPPATSTLGLTPEQIQNLKNVIQNKK